MSLGNTLCTSLSPSKLRSCPLHRWCTSSRLSRRRTFPPRTRSGRKRRPRSRSPRARTRRRCSAPCCLRTAPRRTACTPWPRRRSRSSQRTGLCSLSCSSCPLHKWCTRGWPPRWRRFQWRTPCKPWPPLASTGRPRTPPAPCPGPPPRSSRRRRPCTWTPAIWSSAPRYRCCRRWRPRSRTYRSRKGQFRGTLAQEQRYPGVPACMSLAQWPDRTGPRSTLCMSSPRTRRSIGRRCSSRTVPGRHPSISRGCTPRACDRSGQPQPGAPPPPPRLPPRRSRQGTPRRRRSLAKTGIPRGSPCSSSPPRRPGRSAPGRGRTSPPRRPPGTGRGGRLHSRTARPTRTAPPRSPHTPRHRRRGPAACRWGSRRS